MQTIIGSTELGWHDASTLNADALVRFASVPGVHFIRAGGDGLLQLPGTLVGYANCHECPFSMRDAHKVLEFFRPAILEVQNGKAARF